MIGSLDLSSKEAVIVGGGFSGLISAYYLDRKGFKVSLYEEKQKAGGLIGTRQTSFGFAEETAHSFLVTPQLRVLCEDLKVPLLPIQRDSRARYILRNGVPRRFPLTSLELTQTLYRLSKSVKNTDFGTLEDWGNAVIGRSATEHLLTPFVMGVYGVLPRSLSQRAAFPQLEIQAGSSPLFKFLSSRFSFRFSKSPTKPHMMAPLEGLESLTEALSTRLKERLQGRFHLGEKLTELPQAPNVLLCIPAYEASKLIQDAPLCEALSQVQYTPLVSMTVWARKKDIQLPKGVGVLIPPKENRNALGILFNSSSFINRVRTQEMVSCTLLMGGELKPHLVQESQSNLERIAQTELQELFGLKAPIVGSSISRWPKAIPCYNSGIETLWKIAKEGWCQTPGRLLFGNYTGVVSLRGMVESASKTFR